MAYVICSVEKKGTQFIVENNSELSHYRMNQGYSAVEITSDEFNGLKNNSKHVIFSNGSMVVENNPDYSRETIRSKADLDEYISSLKYRLAGWVRIDSQEPLFVKIKNYFSYLESFDTSALSYPIASNFETYLESQGKTDYVSIRQVP